MLLINADHAPAIFLYLEVAQFNSRVADRPEIIALFSKYSSTIERIHKNSISYKLIQEEIGSKFGNYFEYPERYIADFFISYARILLEEGRYNESIIQFELAEKWLPQLYAGSVSDVYIETGQYSVARKIIRDAIKVVKSEVSKDLLKQRRSWLVGKRDSKFKNDLPDDND